MALWPHQGRKESREIVVDDGIRELHQSILKNGLLQPLLVIDQEMDNLIAGFAVTRHWAWAASSPLACWSIRRP